MRNREPLQWWEPMVYAIVVLSGLTIIALAVLASNLISDFVAWFLIR